MNIDTSSDGSIDVSAEALRILTARHACMTLEPISDVAPLTIAKAYEIQAALTQARLDRGERVIGWKLGYTSLAMRRQMGVDAPNFGPLTDAMLIVDGGEALPSMLQPRVEPEIGLRFATDVPVGADRAAVLAAVGEAHACLEVVDSVWSGYRFTLEDNTADGSSAAGVVFGQPLPLDSIDTIEVSLLVNTEVVGSGRGSDASGHPADGIVWLVEQLAVRGERLRAGDVVITGGLTRAVPLERGSTITGCFGSTTCVSVRRI